MVITAKIVVRGFMMCDYSRLVVEWLEFVKIRGHE